MLLDWLLHGGNWFVSAFSPAQLQSRRGKFQTRTPPRSPEEPGTGTGFIDLSYTTGPG